MGLRRWCSDAACRRNPYKEQTTDGRCSEAVLSPKNIDGRAAAGLPATERPPALDGILRAMSKKKVTFDDIAKYTHFSKTTISRYFNNPNSVTPENKEIIAKALVDLNYHEDKIARVLATGRTEFVGVLVPNLYYHYYAEVLNYLLRTYEEFGYKFLVFLGTGDKEQERNYVQELLAYNIEGLITMSHAIPSSELASYGIPVVGIEREDLHISSVRSDNYMGGVQAASLLAKNDCDILLHVNTFVSRRTPSYDRIRGFMDLCEEHDLPHELIQRKFRDNFEQANAVMHNIFRYIEEKYPGKRKGLFMANDTFANLMLNILVRKYKGLPDDWRIVGFDNSPIASEAVVPISTIGQQIQRIAEEAMELLIELMKTKKESPDKETPLPVVHKSVTPVLIRRETTS